LSAGLPRFSLLPDSSGEESDDELPVFGMSKNSKHEAEAPFEFEGPAKDDEESENEEVLESDFEMELEMPVVDLTNDEIETMSETESNKKASADNDSVIRNQSKEKKDKISGRSSEILKTVNLNGNASKGKKVIKSKAKSLERKMNEVRVRKKKKARHSSGLQSIVEVIHDSDSSDFDRISTAKDEENSVKEVSGAQDADVEMETEDSDVEKESNVNERLEKTVAVEVLNKPSEEIVTIKTPPPLEDAVRLCEELEKEINMPDIDLVELIDEWHQENYITYPGMHTTGKTYRHTPNSEKKKNRNRAKLSVPEKDISIQTTDHMQRNEKNKDIFNRRLHDDKRTGTPATPKKSQKVKDAFREKDLFSPVRRKESIERNKNIFQNRTDTAVSSKDKGGVYCVGKHFENGNEVDKTDDVINDSKTSGNQTSFTKTDSPTTHGRAESCIQKSKHFDNDLDDEWMNTGSFAVDLDFDMTYHENHSENNDENLATNGETHSEIRTDHIGTDFGDKAILMEGPESNKVLNDLNESEELEDAVIEVKDIPVRMMTSDISDTVDKNNISDEYQYNKEWTDKRTISNEDHELNAVDAWPTDEDDASYLFKDELNVDEQCPNTSTPNSFTQAKNQVSVRKNRSKYKREKGNTEPPQSDIKKTSLRLSNELEARLDENDSEELLEGRLSNVTGDCSTFGTNANNKKNQRSENSSVSTERSLEHSVSPEAIPDFPVFDLGFDIDDDIIPPSPEFKASQMLSIRHSQVFNLTNRLSQGTSVFSGNLKSATFENSDSSNYKKKHRVKDKGIRKGPKSRKTLELGNETDIDVNEEAESPEMAFISPESQSILSEMKKAEDKGLGKVKKGLTIKTKSVKVINKVKVTDHDEHFLEDSRESKDQADENCFSIDNQETASKKPKQQLENRKTGLDISSMKELETSFNLIDDDDFDAWIDAEPEKAIIENESSKEEQPSYSQQKTKRRRRTPRATVAPANVTQENDKMPVATELTKSYGSDKILHVSDDRNIDFSVDFFEDEEEFPVLSQFNHSNVVKTPMSEKLFKDKQHTSTPFDNGKGCYVTPFHGQDTSPVYKHVPRKCNKNYISKVYKDSPKVSSSHAHSSPDKESMSDGVHGNTSDMNENNTNNEVVTDDDSFVVVRKQKKVKILDSPLTQTVVTQRNKTCNRSLDLYSGKLSKQIKKKNIIVSDEDVNEIEFDDEFNDSFLLTQNNYIVDRPGVNIDHSSDNEFADSFIKPPNKNKIRKNISSDNFSSEDDFKESFAKPRDSVTTKKPVYGSKYNVKEQPTRKKKQRASNPFIEEEAEMSVDDEDDYEASSDEHEGSGDDHYENSFIQDSQCSQSQSMNTTDIHALYLKSVRSPVSHMGRFKLQYEHKDIDVFSQAPPPNDSEYLEDSFCVGSEPEDEWMLREEEGDDNGLEPTEITMLHGNSSVLQTGRKRRQKGAAAAFLTSRQKAIHQGRMKALDKIKSKFAGKGQAKTYASTSKVISIDDSEFNNKERVKTKASRIQLLSTSSEEDDGMIENSSITNVSGASVSNVSSVKGKKRARFLMSSDDSENEDFCKARSMGKYSKVSHELGFDEDDEFLETKEAGHDVKANDRNKKERLKRQKEKQIKFKETMNSDAGQGYSLGSKSEFHTRIKERFEQKETKLRTTSEIEINDSELIPAIPTSWRNTNPVVLVDSKELNGSQDIISDLRFKHSIKVSAAQLSGCDYIVSNRMAVDRKQWSEFSNGANRARLVDRMQQLGELYDRPCLIIEKDKVKPGEEKSTRPKHWTKYVDRTLAMLVRSEVKVLFTENCQETTQILADLCKLELRKDMGISVSTDLTPEKSSRVKFFLSLPRLSYVHALNLCHSYKTVSEFLKSTISVIELRGKMSKNRATEVYNYVHREFDPCMLPTHGQ